MDWMLLPLRRYAEFSGRSRPREFWMFLLFTLIVSFVAGILDTVLGFGRTYSVVEPGSFRYSWFVSGPVSLIVALALILPSLAVAVRRLHDTDRSGWWLWLGLVPLVGAIVLIVFYCLEGTRGANRFGPDPKGAGIPIG